MSNKQCKYDDPALLEVEIYSAENFKTPLLNDEHVIGFGPKSGVSRNIDERNQISSTIEVFNLVLSICLIISGLVTIGLMVYAVLLMRYVALYNISSFIFAFLVAIILIVSGSCGITMKFNKTFGKRWVLFLTAIEGGCLFVFTLVAGNTFQLLIMYNPYSFYRVIIMGIFGFSVWLIFNILFHLIIVSRYAKLN